MAGPVLPAALRHLDTTTLTTAALGQPGQPGARTKQNKALLPTAGLRQGQFMHPGG